MSFKVTNAMPGHGSLVATLHAKVSQAAFGGKAILERYGLPGKTFPGHIDSQKVIYSECLSKD